MPTRISNRFPYRLGQKDPPEKPENP